LVKLPSADSLGGALSSTGGIAGLVKGQARGSIEDLIKVDQGSQAQGVVQGLGQLLGANQAVAPAAAPAEPVAPQVKEPVKKKGKQKQAKAAGTAGKPVGSPQAQPAAVAPSKPAPKERMRHTFGAF
jgi:hypothetical protein